MGQETSLVDEDMADEQPAAVIMGPRTRLMGAQPSRPKDRFEAFAAAMSSITTLRAGQVCSVLLYDMHADPRLSLH